MFSKFLEKFPNLKIIIFGHEMSAVFIRKLMAAGARGFINIRSTHEVLNVAIDEVYNGGHWVGRRISKGRPALIDAPITEMWFLNRELNIYSALHLT